MKFITYNIKNIEPIKQTATLKQADNEFTKSYITGANIRGAFIGNYMSYKKIEDINEGIHKEKLLKEGLKFLNAYPESSSKTRSMPFPKCYYAKKDDMKMFGVKEKADIYISLNKSDDENEYDKIKKFDFAEYDCDNESLNIVNVKKEGSLHIRKGHNTDNKLFRYEAIAAGTTFKGIIICEDDDYAEECKKILEKGTFYIGGSKGSGYGLCSISNVKITNDNPEIEELEDIIAEDECSQLIVLAMSDIIYRSKTGEYKAFIDEELLKEELGLDNVKLKESFVETDYFTGFNNKWGCRLPNIQGIKAGSVFVYEIEGEIDEDKLNEFINKGIGQRKNDGFGRIAFLTELPFTKIEIEKKKKQKISEINLDEEEKLQMDIIVNRLYRERLKNKLPEIVLNLTSKITGALSINENQWGKLFNMMFLLENMQPEKGIEKLKKYFENINNKKLNTELKYAFQNIKINNEKLQEYIQKELSNFDKNNFESRYCDKIEIGIYKSSISKEEIYSYKLQVFKEIFRLQLRKR